MSMFYRTDTRTETSGGTTSTITSITFLIRQTSSTVQEYAKLTCDIGKYGTTGVPCTTADPRDTLQDGMDFAPAAGAIEYEVVPHPANPVIQLGAGPGRSFPSHFLSPTPLMLITFCPRHHSSYPTQYLEYA